MSWLQIAAELLRDAMGSGEARAEPQENQPPPADIQGVVGLLNKHRVEVDRNFGAVAQILKDQNDRQVRALQIQRRWNYVLTAALVIVAAAVVVGYLRG